MYKTISRKRWFRKERLEKNKKNKKKEIGKHVKRWR
jgi:hypothetical protein